jgi:tetratricopeptide (TPR) repeat protein
LARAVDLAPDAAGARSGLANVLKLLQRPDEALAQFDRALALAPDLVDALVGRGALLHELARYAEALASHEGALALDAGNVRAACNRGTSLAALARHDDAIAVFGRALEGAPQFVEALVGRGFVLSRLGRYADAIPDFERALQLAPDAKLASGAAPRAPLVLRLVGVRRGCAARAARSAGWPVRDHAVRIPGRHRRPARAVGLRGHLGARVLPGAVAADHRACARRRFAPSRRVPLHRLLRARAGPPDGGRVRGA